MADSDKNIRITTSKNKPTLPNIVFTGSSAGTSVLTLEVRDDNSVAFTGTDGDVFSLDYNLSTGTIWSVNDKSGTPLLRSSAGGTIGIAEYGTGVIVGIGQTNPKYKLDVQGWVGFASTGDGTYTILIENGLATGNNALSIRAANSLRFYNSVNTLYTGFIGAQSGVNTTYTLPPTSPATGSSVLQSTSTGVMSWVPMTAGSSSGTVNSGTASYAAYYATSTTAVSENANLRFTGTGISIGGNINSTSTLSGSMYVTGGIGITGNAFIGGTTVINNSTVSTSTTSGALVVSGGVGIGGSFYSPLTSPSSVSGVILTNTYLSAVGGTFTSAMYAANIRPLSGNTVTIQQTDSTNSAQFNNTRLAVLYSTNSTSEANGAIVVTGGVGVGLSVSIAGRLQMFNGANYTSFVSSATSNVTYTLPPTAPAGTATSYLSASTTGVMAWVAAPTSGGSGSINASTAGKVAFYSGTSSISGEDINTFDYNSNLGRLLIANPDTEAVPNSSTLFLGIGTGTTNFAVTGYRKTLAAFITNNAWTNGDLLVLGVAGAGSTVKFAVDYRGYTQIGVPGTGFTLPVTNGSSGQVLTANTNGVASWTTVTGGSSSGGTVYAGTANQMAFYGATGTTVGGSSTFTNNVTTGVVNITHTTESTSTTTGALVVSGGAGFAKTVEAGSFKVGSLNYPAPNVLSSFQKSVNSYAQLVIQNTNSGSTASADFVLNNDISTDTTYYANFGINSSTFSGSSSFGLPNAVYLSATSGDLVIGTTLSSAIRFVVNSSSSDIISMPASGTAVSFFQPIDVKTGNDIRLWNSGNTFYTNFGAGNVTQNYDLFTPTAPVGAGLSIIMVNSSGQMFFAPVVGIGVSPVGSNTAQLRRRRTLTYQFCAGYTPAAAGVDPVVLKIPDSAVDGTTDVTYELKEFDISVETPSSGSSRVMLEKYTGTGAFAYAATGTSLIGGLGLTLSGAGIYVTHTNTFAGAFVTSNDKLRLNFTLLNATHANFSIQLTMEQV